MKLKPLEWQDTYCIIPASDLSYTDAVDEIRVGGNIDLYIRYHIHVCYAFTPDNPIDKIIVSIRNQGNEVLEEDVSTVEEGKAFVEKWRTKYYNDLICALYDTVSDRNE